MKLSNRKNTGASVDMQMTSMIDVTFLLLIFFMTTAGFQQTERELDPAIKVNKPSTARATSRVEPAIVDVGRGTGGKFVFKLGGREMATADELEDVLRKLESKGDGAFIRAENETPFDMAASAIQAAKQAGFIGVTYVPKGK